MGIFSKCMKVQTSRRKYLVVLQELEGIQLVANELLSACRCLSTSTGSVIICQIASSSPQVTLAWPLSVAALLFTCGTTWSSRIGVTTVRRHGKETAKAVADDDTLPCTGHFIPGASSFVGDPIETDRSWSG